MQASSFEFVFDDHEFLLKNPHIQNTIPLSDYFFKAETFARSPEAQIYRPIRNLFWKATLNFFGPNPSVYHLLNIFLHAVNVCLLFTLLTFLGCSFCVALTGSVFFGIHPVSTEVVCWIKSLDDLLAVFFGMLFIIYYYRSEIKTNFFNIFCSCFFYLAAIFSKESALFLVFFPFLIPTEKKQLKTIKIVVVTMTFAYLILRTIVLGQVGQAPYPGQSLAKTLLGMSAVFGNYLFLLVFPVFQRINYMGYSPFNFFRFWHLVLMWITIGAFVFYFFKRHKSLNKELFLLLISFFPVANLVPMMQWQAERFIYFPMVFFSMYCCRLISHPFRRKRKQFLFFFLLYFIFLGFLCWNRQKIWRNNRTLGYSMLESNSKSYPAVVMIMEYNKQKGYHRENVKIGEQYLQSNPEEIFLYNYLAYAYLALSNQDKALYVINKGLVLKPDSSLLKRFKNFLDTQPEVENSRKQSAKNISK